MRRGCLLALLSITIICLERAAVADTAVDAEPFSVAPFTLNTGRTAGWRFTVDAPLLVTHLGLYDWHADGFQSSYPIGIWNQDGTLLNSAIMPGGIDAPILNGFRYVDADPELILLPGETYTIGYFASAIFPNDHMLNDPGWHVMNPLVHQVGPAVSSNGAFPELTLPTVLFTEVWFGPGFQFEVVPAPASFVLLCLAGLRCGRRRR